LRVDEYGTFSSSAAQPHLAQSQDDATYLPSTVVLDGYPRSAQLASPSFGHDDFGAAKLLRLIAMPLIDAIVVCPRHAETA
jgi:hypothetical protein